MFIESLSFLHNSFGYFVQFLHEVVDFNKIILTYIYIYIKSVAGSILRV